MANLLQKKLARELIKDMQPGVVPREAKVLLQQVGYSRSIATDQPGRTIEGIGVQQELKKLGFSVDEADSRVGFLLNNAEEEPTSLKAADMIYKRLGAYAPDKHETKTLNVNVEMTPRLLALKDEMKLKFLQAIEDGD